MPKITEMWAYIAEDQGPDDEGVIGMSVGSWFVPLVGADRERMLSLKEKAQVTAQTSGKKVKLVRFTQREEIEELS